MNHEKIITKENGDKVKINVSVYLNYNTAVYKLSLSLLPKGKRKFVQISFDGYEYRQLNMEQRREYELKEYLKEVSENDIYQAKIELWEKLKPIN